MPLPHVWQWSPRLLFRQSSNIWASQDSNPQTPSIHAPCSTTPATKLSSPSPLEIYSLQHYLVAIVCYFGVSFYNCHCFVQQLQQQNSDSVVGYFDYWDGWLSHGDRFPLVGFWGSCFRSRRWRLCGFGPGMWLLGWLWWDWQGLVSNGFSHLYTDLASNSGQLHSNCW